MAVAEIVLAIGILLFVLGTWEIRKATFEARLKRIETPPPLPEEYEAGLAYDSANDKYLDTDVCVEALERALDAMKRGDEKLARREIEYVKEAMAA